MKKKTTTKESAAKKSAAKKPAGKKTAKKKLAPKKPAVKKMVAPRVLVRRSTLTFLTENLPGFTVGQAKKTVIQAVGGAQPYSFGITQGTLPVGLNFNYMGTLWG